MKVESDRLDKIVAEVERHVRYSGLHDDVAVVWPKSVDPEREFCPEIRIGQGLVIRVSRSPQGEDGFTFISPLNGHTALAYVDLERKLILALVYQQRFLQ